MYNKILVPLDGSELAECVLSHVQEIARGCGVKHVVLLRIVELIYLTGPDEGAGLAPDVMETLNEGRKATAEKYLAEVQKNTPIEGAIVETNTINGNPAEDITDFAKKNNVDLITIATHGRSGLSRWVWGSVADKVLRTACVPVLMIRPKGCGESFGPVK